MLTLNDSKRRCKSMSYRLSDDMSEVYDLLSSRYLWLSFAFLHFLTEKLWQKTAIATVINQNHWLIMHWKLLHIFFSKLIAKVHFWRTSRVDWQWKERAACRSNCCTINLSLKGNCFQWKWSDDQSILNLTVTSTTSYSHEKLIVKFVKRSKIYANCS